MADREQAAPGEDECCDWGERRTVGAHGREIEPRFGELGKDSYIVTSELSFEGCQNSRKKLGMEYFSRANCMWKIRMTKEKACLKY